MEITSFIEGLTSFKNFKLDITENRLFHSIMLINRDEEFLYFFAKALAGEILASGQEKTLETKIKVIKEIHPDLFIYGKEKAIDASTAKDLISTVFVAPYEGDKKVYIISKFDEMQPAPANKLLKTLEEPPEGVTFILLVKNTSRVLQTLLSRAQKFYLEGFSNEIVSKVLAEMGVKDADLLSLEADGNLAEARILASSQNPKKMADFVVKTLKDFKLTTDLSKTLLEADEFKGAEKELLSFFATACELVLRVRAGVGNLKSTAFNNEIKNLASVWNEKALVGVIEAVVQGLKMLEAFVGASNVMDQFFLKILEVRRKCRV